MLVITIPHPDGARAAQRGSGGGGRQGSTYSVCPDGRVTRRRHSDERGIPQQHRRETLLELVELEYRAEGGSPKVGRDHHHPKTVLGKSDRQIRHDRGLPFGLVRRRDHDRLALGVDGGEAQARAQACGRPRAVTDFEGTSERSPLLGSLRAPLVPRSGSGWPRAPALPRRPARRQRRSSFGRRADRAGTPGRRRTPVR